MPKTNINSKKGFTIIEVILVLAIGSLIILMALVALPSLQASQRDSERKTKYAMLETAITNYTSNNRGKLPTSTTFYQTYIKDDWTDPSTGSDFKIVISAATADKTYTATELTPGDIKLITSAKCNAGTEGAITYLNKQTRKYAIIAYLESGIYCQSN